MQPADISHVEIVLLLLLVLVAALALFASRVHIAYPIMLVLGGLVLSFFPHIPRVSLDPNVVIYVILPPLLFSAAFHTSWRDFVNNIVSIVLLAFGLVGFTIYGVAATTRYLLPGFDWKLGLVLGSVVAATDAIAATATAKRLGLPRGITDLLDAESLVNDGSGLVALKFTLAMVISGVTPSISEGVGTLIYLIFAAVAIGLVVAVIMHQVQKGIDDAPIETTLSLVTPYIAYLAAEYAHCSGVLATLACGIFLGRRSSGFYSLHARIEASAFWRTLDFMLNGLVFLVLGLQLPAILSDIHGIGLPNLIRYGALFSAIVIALRLLWVFPGSWISAQIQRRLLRREPELNSPRTAFLVGWAGMRGVLALAAALSLPEHLPNGAPFPQRNLIIFLTFCVIFATLVLQGLSMPALIRKLGMAAGASGRDEEIWARREMAVAARKRLQELRRQGIAAADILDQMEAYYRRRLARANHAASGDQDAALEHQEFEQQRAVAQQLRDAERAALLSLRNNRRIHDEVRRALEYELDLLDARFAESD
ncbi:MAG: Na+/H+ antiporter [Acidobacteriaceae bacterium]|nr:Na+/H+ antiporter [Acidobacteriaceae bacterium]